MYGYVGVFVICLLKCGALIIIMIGRMLEGRIVSDLFGAIILWVCNQIFNSNIIKCLC